MKCIIIQEIAKRLQDYDTVGNYGGGRGSYWIEVSKDKGYVNGNDELDGVIVHELVELLLCLKRGIKIKEIDKWDISHQHTDREPGEIRGAPYFKEHAFSNKLERMFMKELKKKVGNTNKVKLT